MLPFQNVFFSSLFPPFVHPLSICSFFFVSSCFLVSFTFSPFLNFFFFVFLISMFLYVKLFVWKYLFKLLRNSFFFHLKKTSFSLFPFLLGFFFHVWSFSVSWKMVSRFYNPSFFLILLFNSVSLFLLFWCIQKIRICFLSWNVGKTLFCFLFLFSWFKNIFERKKSVLFSTILESTFKILFFSSRKTTKKLRQKNFIFLFLFRPFFCFTFSLNIFFYHFFLCSLFTSLFDFLSFFFSFFTSPSHVSLFFFFSIAIFVYLLFVWPQFSSLSFVLDLIFLFILLLYLFFSSSAYFFARKSSKISVVNFSTWNHVIVFWILPSSVFHLFFFPPWVVRIPCLFHVLLIVSASWQYYSWFSFITLLFGSLKNKLSFCFWTKVSKNIIDTLFIILQTLVFLEFHQFLLLNLFSHAWYSKTFCYFSLFSHSFLKNIWVLLS